MTVLDPTVWGPPFWFTLHTIAMTYPHNPNDITKKKYYEFIQNLPLFIPVEQMGNDFNKLLEEYPITPYLDSRKSLVKWMHFIHNKINEKMEKPKISLNDFYIKYYEEFKPKHIQIKDQYKWREKLIYIFLILAVIILSIAFYNK